VIARLVCFALALGACNSTPEVGPDPAEKKAIVKPATLSGPVELLEPTAGDVKDAVRSAMIAAAARNHRLVVYVGASWCEPCERFREAARKGELNAGFPGLSLLVFDADADRKRLAAAGYQSAYIPLLVIPKDDGAASEFRMEGGSKGEGAVASISPRLTALLKH
jgi:thiol-disulfide isomerase/thioredoxin